jgi:hypothetical protein
MAASINDESRKNVLLNEDILHRVCDYLIDDSIIELEVALGYPFVRSDIVPPRPHHSKSI